MENERSSFIISKTMSFAELTHLAIGPSIFNVTVQFIKLIIFKMTVDFLDCLLQL